MIAPNDTRNWQVSMDDPAAIVEGVDDIVQSINIILTTIPGSDPLRPEFGSNVYQYLDKPLPSVLGKIIYEATTAIGRWEKRLDVTRISASRNDAAIDNNIPTFVERDPAVIMAESKAKLEELLGRELQPAQVEQLILNFVVFRETLLVNRFNAGMRQMLYQFSTAPILDYIAGLVAVERLPAASAGCTVRFTLVAGHGSVLIPEGTRVSSSDGLAIFRTIDDAIIAPATMTVELSVLADVAGKVGNGYAVGTINKILDPLAFVSTVENIDVTGGGSDVESDAQLRERIKLAPSQYSSAGSRSSYKFYAKSANAMITDVSVSSPVPGSVLIVPLTNEEETPAQVITDVYNVCNAENVRPLTDTVIVSAPEREDYALMVDVVLYDGADAATERASITSALEDFAKEKRAKLGLDIIRSHIAQACRLSSVYDVTVVAPAANLIISDEQFPNCTGITVNVTGFSRG